jgi:hypothetical protein
MTRSTNNRIHSGNTTPPIVAKWCIWSIVNQRWLAGQIRIYVWGAMAVLAVFTLTGFLSPETVLMSMFVSGVVIAMAIWLLIRLRRFWLLHIQQPDLRRQALAAMVAYLEAINHPLPRRARDRPVEEDDSEKHTDYGPIR